MLFNSLAFAIFLPIVFGVYWSLQKHRRAQNMVLLLASFIFYGWWDPRFLFLLVANGSLDFFLAQRIQGASGKPQRKRLLLISIAANIGTLGLFKYYDFFATEFSAMVGVFGSSPDPLLLDVILPVGISFYTFQTLSYSIDVYRGLLPASRDPITFLAYVSFFPQLMAGPIERAVNFLPQFEKPRKFSEEKATDGLRQMLWGFFKKAVVADSCAPIVNQIFAEPDMYGGSTLLLGAILFAFQIYCDFSGYTDIALGCARLFGFDLMRNFAYPYFSRDIAEFWRRWHISLSTWFRDYLYLPIGGSRGSKWFSLRNVLIVFVVSGFWHGANWTFIAWGALNGLLFAPLLLRGKNQRYAKRGDLGSDTAGLKDLPKMLLTFALTTIAWVFFRAATLSDAFIYLQGMVDSSLLSIPQFASPWILAPILMLVLVEWMQRSKQHGLEVAHLRAPTRRLIYFGVFATIFFLGRFEKNEFIYFQF